MEEPEENVWSVVRQENEREAQGDGVQNVMRREEHYVGRRVMEMKVQGRRKRGRPKRRRLVSNRRDCLLMKCTTLLHGGVCHRTPTTPHKSH